MGDLRNRSGNRRPSPQLPAFCRSHRPLTTSVRLSSLRGLQGLLWTVLALQLSTLLLLLLTAPIAAPLKPMTAPQPGPLAAATPVPSPFQP